MKAPHERSNSFTHDYMRRVAQDAIAAYIRTRGIGRYEDHQHRGASDTYVIPSRVFPPGVAEHLARRPHGRGHYWRIDVEVTFEVISSGWEWRVLISIWAAVTPTDDEPLRLRQIILADVRCDKPDISVMELSGKMAAFGQTLPAMLLTLAEGRWPVG